MEAKPIGLPMDGQDEAPEGTEVTFQPHEASSREKFIQGLTTRKISYEATENSVTVQRPLSARSVHRVITNFEPDKPLELRRAALKSYLPSRKTENVEIIPGEYL